MAGGRLEAIERCANWVTELDPDQKFPYLQDAIEFREIDSSDGGGIGVFARRDIRKGERLIEIPANYTNLKEPHELIAREIRWLLNGITDKWQTFLFANQVHSADLFSRTRSPFLKTEARMSVLVFLLMAENEQKLVSSNGKSKLADGIVKAASYWSSFLDTWPKDFSSNPLLWTEEELTQIKGTPFHVWATRLRKDVEMFWNKYVWPAIKEKNVLQETDNKMEAMKCLFFKAVAALRSRSHMSAPETAKAPEMAFMMEAFEPPKTPVMIPLNDLINGTSEEKTANTELLGIPGKKAKNILRAIKEIKAGEELLHCYGELDNLSYFQRFGYIPVDPNAKLPKLHDFDRLGLKIPPHLIPSDSDSFRWKQLNKRGHTKERLVRSNNEYVCYGLLAMADHMRQFRRQNPEDCKIDTTPQIHQIFGLSLALNLKANESVADQVDHYMFGKVVIDIIDYNLGLIEAGPTNTTDIALLKDPMNQSFNQITAACARILTREILLKWRHAIRVQYTAFLTDDEIQQKLPPIPIDSRERCNVCWASLHLKTCSKCKKVRYCSRTCQMDDWKDHKKNCQKV